MSTNKMHADEVDIDISLVNRLLADQFPQWADVPIKPVCSAGTDMSQALIFIPYYLNTNPVGVNNARHAIAEILADFRRET